MACGNSKENQKLLRRWKRQERWWAFKKSVLKFVPSFLKPKEDVQDMLPRSVEELEDLRGDR